MMSPSLLLVLLVLGCLQAVTTADNENVPDQCCFSYQPYRIPVKASTGYKVTDHRCAKPGVIFTLKDGRHVCTDPSVEWVKSNMKQIDQHMFKSLINPQTSA